MDKNESIRVLGCGKCKFHHELTGKCVLYPDEFRFLMAESWKLKSKESIESLPKNLRIACFDRAEWKEDDNKGG